MADSITDSIMVSFRGVGSGVDELSCGQRELWGGMLRQQTWMPMGMVLPLPEGSSLDGVAAERLFLTLEDHPDMVQLDICGDTHHIAPAALETCVRTMEAVTVAAATDT